MGEAKRMASAWGPPPYVANKGRPLLPDDRERMLWQAMLHLAPTIFNLEDCDRLMADRARQMANALLREWEQQCRPESR